MALLVLDNARIWTGDSTHPWAGAAVMRDGRFAFVGAAKDANAPAGAARIDGGGRLVLPGLIDAHAHLLNTGFAMQAVDLKGVLTPEEAARRAGERASITSPGSWIRGAGWDQHLWRGAAFPHRRLLDAVAPEHPILLNHTSGHCIWVNSAALRAAGVTRDTEAPYGGAIDLDDDREPSGILRDTAAKLILDAVPRPAPPERVAAMREAIAHAHRLGVTCAHAMDVGRGEYQALLALRDSGTLDLRVRGYLTAERLEEWFARGVGTGDGDDVLRIGGVKFFADGALGSMTAWMRDPYEGSGDTGLALQPPEQLERMVGECLEHGLAPAIHAIGDAANTAVLDIIERTRSIAPELPRRIEHAQLLDPADVPRFAALGVTASMQPIHATQDMAKVDRFWGKRGAGAYAIASLEAARANLAFGSDTPVETMDPIAGIHAAVTRRNASGEPPGGWYPEQRLSLESTLGAYTCGAAQASGDRALLGRIAPGYAGDFIVLSHDLFAPDEPMRILDARVEMTVVGGEVVYAETAQSRS
jgi:predicted amidohydrolase YtcJ